MICLPIDAAQIVGYTSYVVVGDEMAVLQCSARGNPLPTFTWFKGSSRISFTSVKYTRNDTSYSDVTQSILVIRNPTDHDLTTYTCKAENTIAENIPITVEKSITVYATSKYYFFFILTFCMQRHLLFQKRVYSMFYYYKLKIK